MHSYGHKGICLTKWLPTPDEVQLLDGGVFGGSDVFLMETGALCRFRYEGRWRSRREFWWRAHGPEQVTSLTTEEILKILPTLTRIGRGCRQAQMSF